MVSSIDEVHLKYYSDVTDFILLIGCLIAVPERALNKIDAVLY